MSNLPNNQIKQRLAELAAGPGEMPADRFAECTAFLRRTGFILELDRDITANVLASCDEIAGDRVLAYDAQSDGAISEFLGTPGSHFYDELKSGRWTYRIHRCKKP